jgi:hypothetical protein
MTHWNTDEIIEAVQAELPNAKIENTGGGGDVDTDNLVVMLTNGDRLFICGFKTDGYYDDNRSDVDVEMVELSAGKDSRGGTLGVKLPDTFMAYGKLNAMLVTRGFSVVPCMKDHF